MTTWRLMATLGQSEAGPLHDGNVHDGFISAGDDWCLGRNIRIKEHIFCCSGPGCYNNIKNSCTRSKSRKFKHRSTHRLRTFLKSKLFDANVLCMQSTLNVWALLKPECTGWKWTVCFHLMTTIKCAYEAEKSHIDDSYQHKNINSKRFNAKHKHLEEKQWMNSTESPRYTAVYCQLCTNSFHQEHNHDATWNKLGKVGRLACLFLTSWNQVFHVYFVFQPLHVHMINCIMSKKVLHRVPLWRNTITFM